MGDAPSKTGSEADSTTQADTSQVHDSFFSKGLDEKSVIESIFSDDAEALQEINKIVAQLESSSAADYDPGVQRHADERAKILQKKARKADAAAAKKAQAQADSWFKQQIKEGLAEEAELRPSGHEAQVQDSRKRVEVASKLEGSDDLSRTVLDMQSAKAEQAARAALWASAGGPVSKYSSNFSIVGLNLLDMQLPIPPVAHEQDASVPALPAILSNLRSANLPEFYKLLNISVDATFDEVKKGYRREALRWHPDKNRDKTEVAAERFKRISEAFDTLYDPERRAAYDSGALPVEPSRFKKLAGHGWSNLADDDDMTLTPQGLKWKKQSWRGYVLMYGRLDDDPADIIQDDSDPRAPEIKLKVFWRFLAEMIHLDREAGVQDWMDKFVVKVWKDTPSKWPKASELRSMNEASQQEWKERRMVFSRRRQKLRVYMELHEQYLAIPNREQREVERLSKRNPVWVRSFGMDIGAGLERTAAEKADRSSSHLRM